MAIKSESLSILRSLHAEELLDTWAVFRRLKAIPEEMVYRGLPLMEYFEKLQCEINAIGYMQLRAAVTIAEVPTYQIELAGGYERILDGLNRCQIDASAMLGRCKTLRANATNLKGPFAVLWTIGATDIIKGTALGSLGAKTLEALANAEYTDVLDESDVELDAMIEALNLTIASLKMFRRLASDKYNIGRDQINAALSELSNQDQGILDRESPAHVQKQGQSALSAIFGHRMISDARSLVEEEDDLHLEADVKTNTTEPEASSSVEPPALVAASAPEPPQPRKTRKSAKTTPPEELPPVDPVDPQIGTQDTVKVILEDPFLGKQQAAKVLQDLDKLKENLNATLAGPTDDDLLTEESAAPQEPPTEDNLPPQEPPTEEGTLPPPQEDDFPSEEVLPTDDVPSSPGTVFPPEEEEDLSFIASAPVVNKTPASKELAEMAQADNSDPLAPVVQPKTEKVDPPKVVKEDPPKKETPKAEQAKAAVPAAPKAETAPPLAPAAPGTVRPHNGLFRSKSSVPMAPAFTRPAKPTESSPEAIAEFM